MLLSTCSSAQTAGKKGSKAHLSANLLKHASDPEFTLSAVAVSSRNRFILAVPQGGHVGSTASRYHLSCGQVLLLWGSVHFCKAIAWAGLGVVQGTMFCLCNTLAVHWCLLTLSSHVYSCRAQRLAFLHQTWFCICVCQGQKMLPSVVDTAVKGNVLTWYLLWAVMYMSEHWQDITAFGNGRYSWCCMQSAWHAWLM